MNNDYAYLAEIFKLLSNPIRLQIIEILQQANEPVSVKDLTDQIKISAITLSPHLGRLRRLRVIKVVRKDGKVFYKLLDNNIYKAILIIKDFKKAI